MTLMTTNLIFYTTEGCHLCEQAQVLLQDLLREYSAKYQIEIVDIVESEALIQQYGTRIPVLVNVGAREDLGWPFDYQSLLHFIGLANA